MAESRHAQYLVAAAVWLAAMVVGFALAWSTPVLPKFHNNETDIVISDKEISWVAAMSSPGFMTGSLITRFISDRFGRRAVILSSAFPIVTAAVIVVNTASAWYLYVVQWLWGTGSGMISTVSSLYLAEISDKEIRGKLTSSVRYMQTFGSFVIMSIGPFVSYHAVCYLFLIMPVCYFTACCFIPESPYYLLKEGKVHAARASLVKLNGTKDIKEIENRLSVMRVDVQNEMQRSSSIKELFTGKQYRRALILTVGLKITQMFSGTIAIQKYFGRIVQDTKTNVNMSTVLITFGAVRFIVGVCSSAIVDKVGRRPLLIFSYLSCGICLTIVGAYFLIEPTSSIYYSYIPFIGIILSNMLSILGYETMVVVVISEVFPLNVKSIAVTLLNILGGFLTFLSVKGFQELKDLAGLTGVFWFYASSLLLGAIFSYFMVPETKGKSLREIQVQLQGEMYQEGTEKLNNVIVNDETEVTELKELKRDNT